MLISGLRVVTWTFIFGLFLSLLSNTLSAKKTKSLQKRLAARLTTNTPAPSIETS